ncbi:hypothetical protein GN244_ATG07384 [Phytophthora infestans]|uniref:Uncharacterized protein n=1 Tax=Phytophthora infestans TaxID=4787 RepID=A0A833TGA3_PHYIN|nr:hypothetical protein GN244_ATG07384 [Phytophthora infestans]
MHFHWLCDLSQILVSKLAKQWRQCEQPRLRFGSLLAHCSQKRRQHTFRKTLLATTYLSCCSIPYFWICICIKIPGSKLPMLALAVLCIAENTATQ